MQRYAGESLGDAPRIVVLGSCKVGNFVVSTPLLRGLQERWPGAMVDFIGSAVTADFETNCPWIDWRCSWDSRDTSAGLGLFQSLAQRREQYGPVDLAINLDGFNPVTQVLASWLRPEFIAGGALTSDLRNSFPWGDKPQQRFLDEPDWDSTAFLKRHSNWLSSNAISELFCRMAWIETDVHAVALSSIAPSFSVPDVLIHCTTARAAKVWPFEHWRSVIDACNHRGCSVGLVGSPPKAQQEATTLATGSWLLETTDLIDLRGQTTLMELAVPAAKQLRW